MSAAPLPRRVGWLVDGFCRYVTRYLRKHFHAVLLSRSGAEWPRDGGPILVITNHPSWWDALIPVPLALQLTGYHHYVAMHGPMIQKYPLFNRLGFFGLDATSFSGVAHFLRTAQAILAEPNRTCWVTAQGEFADVRTRPLNLKSGVGHLAARMQRGWIVCIAFEYTFWNERTPEALMRIAEAIPAGGERSAKEWTAEIERVLTANLDALNAETQSRDSKKFTVLVGGRSSVGGGYDLFRRFASWLQFQRFRPDHGGDGQ